MRFVNHRSLFIAIFALIASACAGEEAPEAATESAAAAPNLIVAGETHFSNLRQLTHGGQNAEAYWAFDGSALIYQAKKDDLECDQIFIMEMASGESEMVSTGEGRTTCSYFYPSGEQIVYSSTHHHDASCPVEPDFTMGYVWPIYPSYDVFIANVDGSDLRQLTDTDGYDGEATVSPAGDKVVFTSMRDGDLELYSMNLDGSDVRRLTDRPGYDGGAFFSPDGSQIIWRASYPEGEELADYQGLLAEGLLRPGELEIFVMDADGSNQRQVTNVGGANFAPYWHPDGDRILFSSNHQDESGREFDIFMINLDGTGLEQITHSAEFDGFPVFSPDGTQLVLASNRNNGGNSDTNIFIADWIN
jgi:Tol biopolymer transport system component